MSRQITESDTGTKIYGTRIYESIVGRLGEGGFVDRDFLISMRMSNLGHAEEFDNAMAYAITKTFLESGMNWLKRNYQSWLEKIVGDGTHVEDYKWELPPEHPHNFELIRTKLAGRSRGLFWGVIFRSAHEGLINGRFAIESRTFNSLIKVLLGFQSREDAQEFLDSLDNNKRRSWRHPLGEKPEGQ